MREATRACIDQGIEYLTLFAFSSENWRRPAEEVSVLRQLFLNALEQEAEKLHANGVRLKLIGDIGAFGERIASLASKAETLTCGNERLTLTIAANYGGRWDILQAVEKMVRQFPDKRTAYTEDELAPFLAMDFAPEPDLFIRTGGEQRISNFLIWQLAYTELYFTQTLWLDFDADALVAVIDWYAKRERRFGRTMSVSRRASIWRGPAEGQENLADRRPAMLKVRILTAATYCRICSAVLPAAHRMDIFPPSHRRQPSRGTAATRLSSPSLRAGSAGTLPTFPAPRSGGPGSTPRRESSGWCLHRYGCGSARHSSFP